MHVPLYVPKWLLYGFLVVGAVCVGWIGKDVFGGPDATSAKPIRSDQPVTTTDEGGSTPPQPIELTIMMPPGMVGPGGQPMAFAPGMTGPGGQPMAFAPGMAGPGGQPVAMGGTPAGASPSGAPDRVTELNRAGGGYGQVTGGSNTGASGYDGASHVIGHGSSYPSAAVPSAYRASQIIHQAYPQTGFPVPPVARASSAAAPTRGAYGQVSGPSGQLRATTGMGSASTPTRLILDGIAGAFPSLTGGVPSSGSALNSAGGLALNLTPEMAATAIGQNIVIAYDGSVVLVGDNGYLNANTGDVSEGAVVALDAQGSTFSSNYDPTIIGTGAGTAMSPTSAWGPGTGVSPSLGAGAPLRSGILSGGSPMEIPQDASPLVSAFISYTQNRTADIAGFEDHSILARGMGNVLTYDDSNVFIDRTGKINANTGDTDSAGLNAVDTVRSTVSAGPHCDDGCDNESVITAQSGAFDEGDVAIDANGNIVLPEDDSLPFDNGDDTDSPFDESPDGDISDPVEPAETREEADTTREDADTGVDPPWVNTGAPAPAGSGAPPPDGSLTVGGDGIDDLSARVDGVGNVATYDDSNIVIGGTGDVNAQIGDSDTGGTVVMDTVDSVAHGGNSR